MNPDWMTTAWPITRLRFTARMLDDWSLHSYGGGLLRSVLGAALKRQCQHTGPCGHDSACSYAAVFDTPPPPEGHPLQAFRDIPKPFVIEPPALAQQRFASGDALVFHMLLVGRARQHAAAVIAAWNDALDQGLGPVGRRARAALQSVETVNEAFVLPPAPAHLTSVTLHLHTPMRLQHNGQALRADTVSLRIFLAALVRRIALLMAFHADQPAWGEPLQGLSALADEIQDRRDLYWYDWSRYSHRQHREMTLGGLLGTWQLHAESPLLVRLWPWLNLGQAVHVGKNATMGMGAYTLENCT